VDGRDKPGHDEIMLSAGHCRNFELLPLYLGIEMKVRHGAIFDRDVFTSDSAGLD
jgi:hypothetical protein